MNGDLLRRLSAISPEERRILGGGTLDMELYREGSSRNVVQACRVLAGKRIAIRTHTRFTDFPSHRHDYVEIMYVCRGSITHVVGRTPIRVEAGELLFLGCNTWHRILKAGREDIGVNFLVRPEFFRTAFDLMDSQNALSDFILDSLTGAGSADQYLHFRVSDRLPVQNLVENLVWSLYHEEDAVRVNELQMGVLFLLLLQSADRAETGRTPRSIALRALAYLDSSYAEATLTGFALQVGLPDYTASRIIKAQLGATFQQLLTQRRLQAAARLLRTTSLPVHQIVRTVGYENTSYFHRAFRTLYGCSPGEYRANGAGEPNQPNCN